MAWTSPAELGEILRRYEPDIVGGYPSALAKLTEHLSQHDAELKPPRYVGSGGETLTPDLRQQIEEGFRARVYDSYGANEINLIACECPQTGEMHVMDDTVIVEVLNDGRPVAEGERGEVVVTALHSFAMPFIRYRLEDSVIKGRMPVAAENHSRRSVPSWDVPASTSRYQVAARFTPTT